MAFLEYDEDLHFILFKQEEDGTIAVTHTFEDEDFLSALEDVVEAVKAEYDAE